MNRPTDESVTDAHDALRAKCQNRLQHLVDQLESSEGWSDAGELGMGNQVVASNHAGRTILELVQNARDAIVEDEDLQTGRVAVIVGPEGDALHVANQGSPFDLHEDDVFKAVTSLGRSSKNDQRDSIGEKGVGLKSILTSAEALSIRSRIDGHELSARFSRSRTGRLLLGRYRDWLADRQVNNGYTNILESLGLDENFSGPLQIGGPAASKNDDPPDASDIFGDLPRLSLFRYPHLPSTGSERALAQALMSGPDSGSNVLDEAAPELAKKLRDIQTDFRTVVSLDYQDEGWSGLLDSLDEALESVGTEDDTLQTFRDNRSSHEQTTGDQRETLWRECEAFNAETLILLGHIERIDFLKVDQTDQGDALTLEAHRRLEVEREDATTATPSASFEQVESVTVTETDSHDGYEDGSGTAERHFRRYSRALPEEGADKKEEHSEDSNEELPAEPVSLLFELPSDEESGERTPDWASAKPLYLFYPIDEAETPFSFVIHAPFRVQFDRTSLKPKEHQNENIFEMLPEFVADVARDLVAGDTQFRQWLPWILMPLDEMEVENAQQPPVSIAGTSAAIVERLRDISFIPSGNGGRLTPTEVLLDPERLEAFEVLRHADPDGRGDVRLPAEATIRTGQRWRDAAFENRGAIRAPAKALGLTRVVDGPFDEERSGDDYQLNLIEALCEAWGTSEVSDPKDWSIPVDDPKHARQYFDTIRHALERHRSGDDDEEDPSDRAASRLGEKHVPLLPAEAHRTGQESTSGDAISTLVRASQLKRKEEGRGYKRSARLVFRRTETGESKRSILDELPTPPERLRVFVTPYRKAWTGTLENHNRDWGTRNLEGGAGFYRRVAAEAGGYAVSSEVAQNNSDPATIGYLLKLYRQICRASDGRADWLVPEPNRHRRHDDVEKLLKKTRIKNIPSDYGNFLEERYLTCIPLPTRDSDRYARAESLVFGPEWAPRFRKAAEALRDGRVEPAFSEEDAEEDDESAIIRADKLRRWSASIETIAESGRGPATTRVADPDDERWKSVLDELDLTEGSEEDKEVWHLNFLLHLGVQVGPHIEWGWLFPGSSAQDRRTGAMSVSEIEDLIEDPKYYCVRADAPVQPSDQTLERYREICWRAENHPAFSAGHSGGTNSGCEGGWLHGNSRKWMGHPRGDDKNYAIPAWSRFSELEHLESDSARLAFRNSLLLMWPELKESVLQTAWICSGHNVRSHDAKIPSLAMSQLEDAEFWPVTYGDEDSEQDSKGELMAERFGDGYFPARRLTISRGDKATGATRYLPRLDESQLEQSLSSLAKNYPEFGFDESATSAAQALGAKPIDALSPAEAAERLAWFLDCWNRDQEDSQVDQESLNFLEEPPGIQYIREPTYGLMRRLTSSEHLERKIHDQERQDAWLRRDIRFTGTSLPVVTHDGLQSLPVGNNAEGGHSTSIRIYAKRLPRYARDLLKRNRVAFVETPNDATAALARLLGDEESGDGPLGFGLRKESEIPELEAAEGPHEASGEDEALLDRIRKELNAKLPFLLAAYRDAQTGGKDLETVYGELSAVARSDIGLIEPEGEHHGGRHSAQWNPAATSEDESRRVAIYKTDIWQNARESGDSKPPAYLVADGLAQVLDSLELESVFENVLMSPNAALEYKYGDTLSEINADITELHRATLSRIHSALSKLADTAFPSVRTPSIDLSKEPAPKATVSAAREASDANESDESAFVEKWSSHLQKTGMTRETAAKCIRGAAIGQTPGDSESFRSTMLEVAEECEAIDLRELAERSEWTELRDWPAARRGEKRFIEAVAALHELILSLESLEDGGDDDIRVAAEDAHAAAEVEALAPIGSWMPPAVRDEISLESSFDADKTDIVPTVQLTEKWSGERFATKLGPSVANWFQERIRSLLDSKPLLLDEDTADFLEDLVDVTCSLEEFPENLWETIDRHLDHGSPNSTHAQKKRMRRQKTNDWASATDEALEDIDYAAPEMIGEVDQHAGSSPGIDNARGGGGHTNAEFGAERGRDAELICLSRCWRDFAAQNSAKRSRILQELVDWRDGQGAHGGLGWRLTSTADLTFPSHGANKFSEAKRLLETDGLSPDDSRARRLFAILFDVSNERGPGFDLIDPFGKWNAPTDESGHRTRVDFRRIEVKATKFGPGDPEKRKGRIKLTGNEFRMARRPGPCSPSNDETPRYLVRIVTLPKQWRENPNRGISVADIEDFVSYAKFNDDAEPVWEKLRGGKFYINFGS